MKRTKEIDDRTLEALLATYHVSVDTGDDVAQALAGAARIRAVQLKDDLASQGFFGMVAAVFGLRRASAAAWSAALGMAVAAVIGISVGASGRLTTLDETALSIDFDSVMGAGTLNTPMQTEQDL